MVHGLTLLLVSLVSREKKERAVLYHPYDNRLGFAIFKSQCPKGSRNVFLPSSCVAVPNSIFHLLTKIISFFLLFLSIFKPMKSNKGLKFVNHTDQFYDQRTPREFQILLPKLQIFPTTTSNGCINLK
jgi:hypothetical protein